MIICLLVIYLATPDKDVLDPNKKLLTENALYLAGIIQGIYELYSQKLLSGLNPNYFIYLFFCY